MRWQLLRQDTDGSRVLVSDFGTQQEALDALAAYEHHYPEYAPYFVEATAPVASPAPPAVQVPAPRIMPAPVAVEAADAPPMSNGMKAGLLAVVGAIVIGAALIFTSVLGSSDNTDPGNERELVSEVEERPTQGPEPTAPPTDPPPTRVPETTAPPPTSTPPPPTPTPEEDEVRLTQGGNTTETIIARGELLCGVSGRMIAFSEVQSDGSVTGFDADMCRALAAAILGDAEAVEFVPLTAAERFTRLQTGEVDVLMRNSTFTQSRDTDVGVDFGPTTFYDGQQLMGRASDGFTSQSQIEDIERSIVCAVAGTTTELIIAEKADEAGVNFDLTTFDGFDIITDVFIDRGCDLVTFDGSLLAGTMAEQQPADEEWVIFPPVPLSKEPLGPIYRQDDSRFADVVNWTVYAMLTADEQGINQENVFATISESVDPIDGWLGGPAELQSGMGLAPDAFFQVIAQVGSYSDVFKRHLEPHGLVLEGSLNDLWINGGIMYPPPAR